MRKWLLEVLFEAFAREGVAPRWWHALRTNVRGPMKEICDDTGWNRT